MIGKAEYFWQEKRTWWPLLAALIMGLLVARLPLPISMGLLGGTAVFLLILRFPLFGLGLAMLLGPLGAVESLLIGNSLFDSGQLTLFFTLAIWIAQSMVQRELRFPQARLAVPLLIFGSIMLLTLYDAPSYEAGLREIAKWGEMGLILLLVVDVVAREKRPLPLNLSPVQLLIAFVLLAGFSQAALGVYQFAFQPDAPEHFRIFGRFFRAYGTFNQPNPFGGFMNLAGLLGIGVLLGWSVDFVSVQYSIFSQQKSVKQPNTEHRIPNTTLIWLLFVLGTTAVIGAGLIASWSRGAWLGFVAGGAAIALFLPLQRWKGAVLLGLGTVGLLLALQLGLLPSAISERLTGFTADLSLGDVRGVDINDGNYAVLERLAHWQAAQAMADDFPWLGVGFGNYEPAYEDYRLINWPDALGHAHNYYLNLLAETGIVGFVAYLGLWTAVFWQNLRLLPQVNWQQRGVLLGLLAVWVAFATHHLVDKLYVNNLYIHLGVLFAMQQLIEDEAENRNLSQTQLE